MKILITLVLLLAADLIHSQEKTAFSGFGEISAEHLQRKVYAIDSNAGAVVLSDIAQATVEGNTKGWFSISFTRHRVVHILSKNGYHEANVRIPLYTDGSSEEKLESVKATTYNLERGKIAETRLERTAVFTEKSNLSTTVKKFTFPRVKEGSIIEYEYKITSDFIWNLDPWDFQGASPVLWSEYTLTVPGFFTYIFVRYGHHPLYIDNKKESMQAFTVTDAGSVKSSERYRFTAGVTDYRWVMKDVPVLTEERFTSSLKNHVSRIEFQLASQNHPLPSRDYRSSWEGLAKELLESENFGADLDKNNGWLADEVKPLLAGVTDETAKAKKLYAFIRDNFTCVDYSATRMYQPLKNVMRARKGNVAEINLLLVAMLRYAGLQADPVLLSTTNHGYALELYPLTTSFNYVICRYRVFGKYDYLDASRPRLGFGKLPAECYNGHARVVNAEAPPVYFSADSVTEKKETTLFITNDEKENWTGNVRQIPGCYESWSIREEIKETGEAAFFRGIAAAYGQDIKITEFRVDSLASYEEPVQLTCQFDFGSLKDDILYINPMFGEGWEKNPFVSAQRFYPVEMPYTIDETFILTMEVPSGYVVDELPKQLVAKLDEKGSALFEYRISQSGNTISFLCKLKISRAFFGNEEYHNLRQFFNLVVNKQNEQIVFKKKK